MTSERRRTFRRAVALECSWHRDARVTDVTSSSCYVDSPRVPAPGTHVEFTINLEGAAIRVDGTVIHAIPRLGFAMRFADLDMETRIRLHAILEKPVTD